MMPDGSISVQALEVLPDPSFPDETMPPEVVARIIREATAIRSAFLETYFEVLRHPPAHLARRFTPEQHLDAIRAILGERSAEWWTYNYGPAELMISNVCYQLENFPLSDAQREGGTT